MNQIHEKKDLSKQVLDIDVESPIFEVMLSDLDIEIKKCIKKVYDKEFSGGDITLKISLDVPEAFKDFPTVDPDTNEMTVRTYSYRTLAFKHKVTTVLKQQFVRDGEYKEERELKETNGEFVAVPLENPQTSIFDSEEGV